MTRQYEAVYVFDSTLEDAAITEKLGRFHSLLGTPGDLQVNHWGRRQLAYPIGRRESGYYVIARFGAEPATLPEYERAIKLDEGIVRHLITLFEHEVGAPPMTELSGVCARHQRQLSTAIKRARYLAIIPYIRGMQA
jgi:small subunit ribosomal protein S6